MNRFEILVLGSKGLKRTKTFLKSPLWSLNKTVHLKNSQKSILIQFLSSRLQYFFLCRQRWCSCQCGKVCEKSEKEIIRTINMHHIRGMWDEKNTAIYLRTIIFLFSFKISSVILLIIWTSDCGKIASRIVFNFVNRIYFIKFLFYITIWKRLDNISYL